MKRTTSSALLAVVAVGASIAGRAQVPQPQAPQATVRELATIEGMMNGYAVLLPSGRALIYTPFADGATMNYPRVGDSTFVVDIATKRRTLLGTNMLTGSVSPQGDRFAFDRTSEDGTGDFLWSMPIDPMTGIGTGQAQRVSLLPKNGVSAKFSPDGQMLVFNAARPDGTFDLTIVSARGGPERVLANYARSVSQAWSADGKSVYVSLNASFETVIDRVPVSGGRSQPLVPRTSITAANAVGLSPDARVAFFQRNPDRFFYWTAWGGEGEISVALPPPIDDGSGRNMTLDSLRYISMTHVSNQRVRVLDLATGQARDLLPGNAQSKDAAWSPDGRRLAVLSGSLSHYDITVVNADGSSPRRYSVPMQLENWDAGAWPTWSPDGRFLAFRAKAQTQGRQTVGWHPDDRQQLGLLDVNSGQTRVLTTSAAEIAHFVWRSDGNAIRFEKQVVPHGSSFKWSIAEIPLSGPERVLRDLSAEFPKTSGFQRVVFASDREAVVTAAADRSSEWFLVPLDGGSVRRLPDPGVEPGSRRMGTRSVAGNQLLLGQVDAKGEARFTIVSTVGAATRTLRLPFSLSSNRYVVLPDGRQIVAAGKAAGDSVNKLFLVPLDGSPTRVIGDIPRGAGGDLAVSPDGKRLAYTSDGPITSKIYEIDFGPALQAIMKQ